MRLARFAVAILVAGCMFSAVEKTDAQVCLPTFGYGNVGLLRRLQHSAGWLVRSTVWRLVRTEVGGAAPARMPRQFRTQEPAVSLSQRRLTP